MQARLALLLVAVAFVAPGAGAATAREQPDVFLNRILHYLSARQFDREYANLVAGQRRLIRKRIFVGCWSNRIPLFDVVSAKLVTARPATINFYGVTQRHGLAVTMRVVIVEWNGVRDHETDTWHLVDEGGQWRWMLSSSDARVLHRGKCPS